jgi:hypothetical protein
MQPGNVSRVAGSGRCSGGSSASRAPPVTVMKRPVHHQSATDDVVIPMSSTRDVATGRASRRSNIDFYIYERNLEGYGLEYRRRSEAPAGSSATEKITEKSTADESPMSRFKLLIGDHEHPLRMVAPRERLRSKPGVFSIP